MGDVGILGRAELEGESEKRLARPLFQLLYRLNIIILLL